MTAGELRESVSRRIVELAGGGDEKAIASGLDYAKALLLALTPFASNDVVELENLTVGIATAALILNLHPEYAREIVRHGVLVATKENGEYRIALAHVVDYKSRKSRSGGPGRLKYGVEIWPSPTEKPQRGSEPA